MSNITIENLGYDLKLEREAMDTIAGAWGWGSVKRAYRKAKKYARRSYRFAGKGYSYVQKGLDYKRRAEVYMGTKVSQAASWIF